MSQIIIHFQVEATLLLRTFQVVDCGFQFNPFLLFLTKNSDLGFTNFPKTQNRIQVPRNPSLTFLVSQENKQLNFSRYFLKVHKLGILVKILNHIRFLDSTTSNQTNFLGFISKFQNNRFLKRFDDSLPYPVLK